MSTPANNSPAARTIEKVTTTRIIPDSGEKKTPDFWTYLESLGPEEWEKHILYIYRRLGDTGPGLPLEKICGSMLSRDGKAVSMTNREEVEFALAHKYGGGMYRLIMKRGSERVGEGKVNVDGPPASTKPGILADASPPPAAAAAPVTSDVATHAMDLVANKDANAIEVSMRAMTSAADIIQRLSSAQNSAPAQSSDMDQMFKALMLRMLEREMTHPDPLDQLTKLLTVMQSLNVATNPGAATNPAFGRILDVALERFVNPSPSGPAVSTGAELVRQLPQVANYITEGVREWRMGLESQERMMGRMQPPGPPGSPQATILPAPRPNAGAIPAAPSPAAAGPVPGNGAPQVMAPSIEFIEVKLIEIFKEPISADQAADEALAFLDRAAPQMLEQLSAANEQALMNLFNARPILREATANVPRLQEFIRAFLRYLKESEAESVSTSTVDAIPPVETAKKPN